MMSSLAALASKATSYLRRRAHGENAPAIQSCPGQGVCLVSGTGFRGEEVPPMIATQKEVEEAIELCQFTKSQNPNLATAREIAEAVFPQLSEELKEQ